MFQKERIKKREIVAITAHNYIRSFKLFIDMNFDMPPINWKKITRGLPSYEVALCDDPRDSEKYRKV